MEPDLSNFAHLDHIKDEPCDDQEAAEDVRLPAMSTDSGRIWANLPHAEGLTQTLAASYHDVHEIGTSKNAIQAILNETPSSLSRPSAPNGNTYHVPPFRYLEEAAGAGEQHMMLPTMQVRHEDRYMLNYSLPSLHMPPDGYGWHSSIAPLRDLSRPPGQYDLSHFASQGNSYAVSGAHAYPPKMPAPQMLVASTLDPSRLLHRQTPMSAARDGSVSDSDGEMDYGDEPDPNWKHQVSLKDDDGWNMHPDTICLDIPKFDETRAKGDVRNAAGVRVSVSIRAHFVLKKTVARQRKWLILYRRNYFGIQASYTLVCLPKSTSDETLYLHLPDRVQKPIRALYMCMRGVMDTEDGPEIKVVVFNAKRKPLHQGSDPPPIEPQRMKPLKEGSNNFFSKSTGSREDNINVPMNHTFHRNQFRAATQNNGARRTDQQVYHILLELKAEVIVNGVPELFTVASKMSEPLVVRGRCPLSFQVSDNDLDCDTHDPDRRGRKKPPRGGRAGKTKKGLTAQSPKKKKAKEDSHRSCDKYGGSNRRSTRATRASSHLPSLTYGTGSGSNNTALVTPLRSLHIDSTLNRETIPHLEDKLRDLAQESWAED